MSPEPSDTSAMRATDADRARYVEVLSDAFAVGRLDPVEYEERLGQALSARTYGELKDVLEGLPVPPGGVPSGPHSILPATPAQASVAQQAGGVPSAWRADPKSSASGSVVAFMSGSQRVGPWVAPERMSAVAVMGGVELDFSQARFSAGATEVTAVAIMGGVLLKVPEDMHVEIDGIGFMGGFQRNGEGQGVPGAPHLRVRGFAFWGGVEVKRIPRRPDSIAAPPKPA